MAAFAQFEEWASEFNIIHSMMDRPTSVKRHEEDKHELVVGSGKMILSSTDTYVPTKGKGKSVFLSYESLLPQRLSGSD